MAFAMSYLSIMRSPWVSQGDTIRLQTNQVSGFAETHTSRSNRPWQCERPCYAVNNDAKTRTFPSHYRTFRNKSSILTFYYFALSLSLPFPSVHHFIFHQPPSASCGRWSWVLLLRLPCLCLSRFLSPPAAGSELPRTPLKLLS